jgi:RNA polymerase sigma-70 factor (ECF subfamily)
MAMDRLARFESRVLPHLDAAYNLARWLTRSDADAQDVVQESMLRAFRFFDALRDDDARAWLLAIVRNSAYTWIARNRPAEIVALDEAALTLAADEAVMRGMAPTENPEVIVLQSAQRKIVNQALEELPVAFREVLVMREIEDLSYKEIAQVAGIPIGTVMSRLARGRALLKTALAARMEKAS